MVTMDIVTKLMHIVRKLMDIVRKLTDIVRKLMDIVTKLMDIVTKLMDIVTKLLVGKLVMNSMSAAAEWTTEKARVRMNAAASAVARVMATGTGMASEAPNTDTATATAMAVMVRMVNMGIPTVGTPRTFMAQRTARMASAVKKPAMASTDMASATDASLAIQGETSKHGLRRTLCKT